MVLDQAKLLQAINEGIKNGFNYSPGTPLNMEEKRGGLSALVFYGFLPQKWEEIRAQNLPDETAQMVINHQIDIFFGDHSVEKMSAFFLITEKNLSIEKMQQRLKENSFMS